MLDGAKLLAWIEPQANDEFLAAYVGSAATERAPATQICRSSDEARDWVRNEAAALGVPIHWVSDRS